MDGWCIVIISLGIIWAIVTIISLIIYLKMIEKVK